VPKKSSGGNFVTNVKQLGTVAAGDELRANDHEFVVVGVHTDNEGCQQWTLAVPQSRCLKMFNKKENDNVDGH
jgi:hypothetical protein